MRINYDQVFTTHPDGAVEPRQRIRIGGVEFGPGVRFREGVSFGGVDLAAFKNHDLEVKTEGELTIITGIY